MSVGPPRSFLIGPRRGKKNHHGARPLFLPLSRPATHRLELLQAVLAPALAVPLLGGVSAGHDLALDPPADVEADDRVGVAARKRRLIGLGSELRMPLPLVNGGRRSFLRRPLIEGHFRLREKGAILLLLLRAVPFSLSIRQGLSMERGMGEWKLTACSRSPPRRGVRVQREISLKK